MKLSAIEIENFKGIGKRQRIEFAPLTLLFGPNSAGKSTVLQAIQYARKILGLKDAGIEAAVGGDFLELVHNKDLSNSIRIRLEGPYRKVFHYTCGGDMVQEPSPRDEAWEGRNKSGRPAKPGFAVDYFRDFGAQDRDEWRSELDAYDDTLKEIAQHWFLEIEIGWDDFSGETNIDSCRMGLNDREVLRWEAEQGTVSVNRETANLLSLYTMFPVEENGLGESQMSIAPKTLLGQVLSGADELRDMAPRLKRNDGSELAQGEDSNWISFPAFPGWTPSGRFADLFSRFNKGVCAGTKSGGTEGFDERRAVMGSKTELLQQMIVSQAFGSLSNASLRPPISMGSINSIDSRLVHIGPIRKFPEQRDADKARDRGWYDGTAAWGYATLQQCLETLNRWIQTDEDEEVRFLAAESFEINGNDPVLQRIRSGTALDEELTAWARKLPMHSKLAMENSMGTRLTPKQVGVGISQALPVIVAIARPSGGDWIFVEQPELHIHPRLQTAMAQIFADRVMEDADPVWEAAEMILDPPRAVIETHSELFILRLCKLIGNPAHPITVADISVNYLCKEDGQTVIHPIRVDETGEFLDRWPQGFFEERSSELFDD